MPYRKRSITLITTTTPVSGTVGFGATAASATGYGRILGANVLLTGTDTAIKLKIADKDGFILYLDAADRDYKTAEVRLVFVLDDTTTGLTGYLPVDATGAARAAGEGSTGLPPCRGPVTVSILNGGTVTDSVRVDLICEV